MSALSLKMWLLETARLKKDDIPLFHIGKMQLTVVYWLLWGRNHNRQVFHFIWTFTTFLVGNRSICNKGLFFFFSGFQMNYIQSMSKAGILLDCVLLWLLHFPAVCKSILSLPQISHYNTLPPLTTHTLTKSDTAESAIYGLYKALHFVS